MNGSSENYGLGMQNVALQYQKPAADEPDGSQGSVLAAAQSLSNALASLDAMCRAVAEQIEPILVPQMKEECNSPPTVPEPTRSDMANRLHTLMLRTLETHAQLSRVSDRIRIL